MLEKFDDLKIEELSKEGDFIPQLSALLKEQLGIGFEEMTQSLSEWVKSHAEELTHEFVNIAPYEQYDKILEDNDSMAEFLKTEAHKPENWELHFMGVDKKKDLLEVIFSNKAVDDGDSLRGYVFVSKSGKIRHAFAQGE